VLDLILEFGSAAVQQVSLDVLGYPLSFVSDNEECGELYRTLREELK